MLDILRTFCSLAGHRFWSDDISILDIVNPGYLFEYSQITDLYLLGLAAHQGGKLASFDQHIPLEAVNGGGEAFECIIP